MSDHKFVPWEVNGYLCGYVTSSGCFGHDVCGLTEDNSVHMSHRVVAKVLAEMKVQAPMTPDKIGDLKAHLQRIASDDPKLEYYSITSKQARWLLDAAFSADDPQWDCTDAAHPAWWRGQDYGANAIVREVGKILDGTHDASGTTAEPWESTRRKLIALVSAEERVQQLEAEAAAHDCFDTVRGTRAAEPPKLPLPEKP